VTICRLSQLFDGPFSRSRKRKTNGDKAWSSTCPSTSVHPRKAAESHSRPENCQPLCILQCFSPSPELGTMRVRHRSAPAGDDCVARMSQTTHCLGYLLRLRCLLKGRSQYCSSGATGVCFRLFVLQMGVRDHDYGHPGAYESRSSLERGL
jgi:hypothetical protein